MLAASQCDPRIGASHLVGPGAEVVLVFFRKLRTRMQEPVAPRGHHSVEDGVTGFLDLIGGQLWRPAPCANGQNRMFPGLLHNTVNKRQNRRRRRAPSTSRVLP